jgi:transcriptional regulator with XRE-family HTH domain
MVVKERPADIGSRRARQILAEMGRELYDARRQHGISQAAVGKAVRVSRSQVGRIERAEVPGVPLVQIARLLAVVGLELECAGLSGGTPIRDAAHRALLDRFRGRVAPSVAWRFEVPVGHAGDLRAWDAVLLIGAHELAVEAETRPRDVQALQRRLAAKLRDDPGVSGVVLLLADTRHNRSLMKEHGAALRTDLALPSEAILGALAEGRDPGGSGIVLV